MKTSELRQIIKEEIKKVLNEGKGKKFANQFKQKNNKKPIKVEDALDFALKNWKKMTGEKFNPSTEGWFPDEIEEFIDELGIDYDEFSQAIVYRYG